GGTLPHGRDHAAALDACVPGHLPHHVAEAPVAHNADVSEMDGRVQQNKVQMMLCLALVSDCLVCLRHAEANMKPWIALLIFVVEPDQPVESYMSTNGHLSNVRQRAV